MALRDDNILTHKTKIHKNQTNFYQLVLKKNDIVLGHAQHLGTNKDNIKT